MRLTGKNGNKYGFITENNTLGVFDDNSIADKCYTKLGQLEDLEDELGIDLVTLFKALKDGIYYKYKPYGYDYKISKCRKCYLTGKRTLVVAKHTYKYLCDYGKTWALTKEELL